MHRLKFLVPLCPVAWFVVLSAFGITLGVLLNQLFNEPTRASANFPAGFISETVVGSGLTLPTALAFAPNDTLFIAEKRGVVRVWQRGSLLATPFIDLQDEVNDFHDRGLLGLAVHPNFPATPYVYLLYTYDPPGVERDAVGARVSRLLRVTADADNPNVAATAAGSRVVLLAQTVSAPIWAKLRAKMTRSTWRVDAARITSKIVCRRITIHTQLAR